MMKPNPSPLLALLLVATQVHAKTKPAASPNKAHSAKEAAKPLPPPLVKGKFTDSRDGKSYTTVVVGKQTWMTRNLDFASNGSACYENKKRNCEELGRLYEWDAAKTACPSGWHLPSEDEWDVLESSAGGPDSAGMNLKASKGWDMNGNGTDSKGFDAIASGHADKTGIHSLRGSSAAFWTASSKMGGGAWFRQLGSDDKRLVHDKGEKGTGLSVRCLKD